MTTENKLDVGCLIEFDPGDQGSIKKGKQPNTQLIGVVTALEGDIIQILYFQEDRRQISHHNFAFKNMKYKVLSRPIRNRTEFLNSLGANKNMISDIIKQYELVDPQDVYPIAERIDYNGLNEGLVQYDMNQLIAATIRCHIALHYYETIFNELPGGETNEVVWHQQVRDFGSYTSGSFKSAISTNGDFVHFIERKLNEETSYEFVEPVSL